MFGNHKFLAVLLLHMCSFAAAALNHSAVNIENDVLHFSYELERLLDNSKQPCQDFYGYVCARSSNLSESQMEQRRKIEQQRFERFLTAANEDKLLDMELKLKNFHKSCETNRGVVSLKNSMLYKTSGKWPAVESSTYRTNLTWLSLLGNFHEIGAAYFFETAINIKSNKRVVELQPDLSIRHTMRKFEQLVSEVLRSYGVEQSRTPLVALEVLSFERCRRDIVSENIKDEPVEFTYENFKRNAFRNVSAHFNWDRYFKKVLGKTLKPSDTIIVKQMPRLTAYFGLLQNTTMNRLQNWLWTDYLMDVTALSCQQLAEYYMADVYEHIVQHAGNDRPKMAQMYAAIGKAYKEQLATTVWIDEMSQQSSQQFLGRIMHFTLNGDEKLDAAYTELPVGKRNFYRNLENLQRYRAHFATRPHTQTTNAASQLVKDYAQIFRAVNVLLGTQNLSTPLNYLLVGEHFARSLIAAGSSSHTPGAWRSMDSERQFAAFQSCTARGLEPTALAKFNMNDMLLELLAQQQAWHCYNQWLNQEGAQLQTRLNTLLGVGRLKLSLKRLFFIASQLVDCKAGLLQQERRRQLQHGVLRNTPEFSEAFGCRSGDALYAKERCNAT